jgi:hypothetical protein
MLCNTQSNTANFIFIIINLSQIGKMFRRYLNRRNKAFQ